MRQIVTPFRIVIDVMLVPLFPEEVEVSVIYLYVFTNLSISFQQLFAEGWALGLYGSMKLKKMTCIASRYLVTA
jgi:hypothetical protein